MTPQPKAAQLLNRFELSLLRSKVFGIIKTKSFFREKITLASGRESDFYFDLKPTMFSPEGAAALSEIILQRLRSMKVDYVGGLELGAVPLVSTVTAYSHTHGGPAIRGFFVRKEIKGHGTKKLVEGLARGDTLQQKSVVILDDVTTTGGSAMNAVTAAKDAGADVVLVLSVVDRGEGAIEFYQERGIPFDALFTAAEFMAD